MTSFGDFNLYEELEITKEATPEEIKKAYKKLVMVKYNMIN
jgi:DnaJ-class molecular chaperone